ncbi:LuxR family transcriptional regulator [Rhizobium daejeonense]|uniref:LuxR family transcriptional regulator n=1 Tax=Rhizobium daejeonense TaxID=240521 RepID=A0A6M1RVX5_9HYPH|nr:helix-turn-helix transcriptional regulator [Rhizobium daejeonense]NGO62973.1 LuxR family transcriptional regulator [Rhizobium daejeonense]
MGEFADRNEILARIQLCGSLADIDACMLLLQERFEFRFYQLFATLSRSDDTLRGRLLLYSVRDEFLDGFDAIGGLPLAPETVLATSGQQLFQWSIDELRCRDDLKPQILELIQLLVRQDMLTGIYFSLPTLDGRRQVLSLLGRRPPLTAAEIEDFCFLAIHILDRAGMLEKRLDGPPTGMSNLEILCLEMAAAGLDTAEMAQRLSLSTRTVNYLVNSLCRKLGCERLEQALQTAIKIGFV